MLDSMRNLKVSEIELRRGLPKVECDWLVDRLRAHRDVMAARCGTDARRLTIEYDADGLGSADLVELLADCGAPVASVQARCA